MNDRTLSRDHDAWPEKKWIRTHDPETKGTKVDNKDPREHREVKPLPGDHPKRKWHDAHLQAGYHLQTWHPVVSNHPILGRYRCDDGRLMVVSYLEVGPTGAPEYLLDFDTGLKFTVLDHTVVEDYIETLKAQRA